MLLRSAAIPITTVPTAPPMGDIISMADARCVSGPSPLIDRAKMVGNIMDSTTKMSSEATNDTTG